MARMMKEEDLTLLRVEFDRIDDNKDGKLDLKEFRKFVLEHFEKGQVSHSEIKSYMPEAFQRGGENAKEMKIDFEEYVEFQASDPGMRFDVCFVRRMKEAAQLKFGLCLYLPFLLLFMFFLMAGKGSLFVGQSFWARDSILAHTVGDEFTQSPDLRYFKGYEDQTSFGEFWEWFEVPGISTCWGEDEEIAKDQINKHNLPVGAMRIRQVRVEPVECPSQVASLKDNAQDTLDSAFVNKRQEQLGYACFPELVSGAIDTLPHPVSISRVAGELDLRRLNPGMFTDSRERDLVGEAYQYRSAAEMQGSASSIFHGRAHLQYAMEGHALIIPFSWTKKQVLEAGAMLKDGIQVCTGTLVAGACLAGENKRVPWLDSQTRAIVVEFMTYNQDLKLVVRTQMFTEVTATGHFLPLWYTSSFRFFDWSQSSLFFALFAFFLFFIFIMAIQWFTTFWGMVKLHKKSKEKGGFIVTIEAVMTAVGEDVWISIEFMNLVLFAVANFLRVLWIMDGFTGVSVLMMDEYPSKWEEMSDRVVIQSAVDGVNALLTVIRVLYFLRINSQLNILTKTFETAKTELFGIMFIFLIVFIAFALMAHIVFGTKHEDFYSVTETVVTMVRCLLGDFDYPSWREESQIFTPFVFFLFTVIGNFLVFNMVIAVLTQAFSKVQEEKFHPDKLNLLIQSLKGMEDPDVDHNSFNNVFSRYDDSCFSWIVKMVTKNVLVNEVTYAIRLCKLYATRKSDMEGGEGEWYHRMQEIQQANPRTYWIRMETLIFAMKRATDFTDKLKVNPVPVTHYLLEVFGEDLPEVVALNWTPPGDGAKVRTEQDRKRDHLKNHDLCINPAHAMDEDPQSMLVDVLDFVHVWQDQVAPKYAELEVETDDEDIDEDDMEREIYFDPEDAEEGIAMRGGEDVAKTRTEKVTKWRRMVDKAKFHASAARTDGASAMAVAAAAKLATAKDLAEEQEKMLQNMAAKKATEKSKDDLERLLEFEQFDELAQLLDNLQYKLDKNRSAGVGQLSHDGVLVADAHSLLVPQVIKVSGASTITVPAGWMDESHARIWDANGTYERRGERNGRPAWRRRYDAKGNELTDDPLSIIWADGQWWMGVPRESPYGRACVPALHVWQDSENLLPPKGKKDAEGMQSEVWSSVVDGGYGHPPVLHYSVGSGKKVVKVQAGGRRESSHTPVAAEFTDDHYTALPRLIEVTDAGTQHCNGTYELQSVDPEGFIPLLMNGKPLWRRHHCVVTRYFDTESYCIKDKETDRVLHCYLRIQLKENREEIGDANAVGFKVPGEFAPASRHVTINGDWQATKRAYSTVVRIARSEKKRLFYIQRIEELSRKDNFKEWFERVCRDEYNRRFGEKARREEKARDKVRIAMVKQDRENFLSPRDPRHMPEPFLRECAMGFRKRGRGRDKSPAFQLLQERKYEFKDAIKRINALTPQEVLPEVFYRPDNIGELRRVPDDEVLGTDGFEGNGLIDFVNNCFENLRVPRGVWNHHSDVVDDGFDLDIMWQGGRWALNARRSATASGYVSFDEEPPRVFLLIIADRDGEAGDRMCSRETAKKEDLISKGETVEDPSAADGEDRARWIRRLNKTCAIFCKEWQAAKSIAQKEVTRDGGLDLNVRRSTWAGLAQQFGVQTPAHESGNAGSVAYGSPYGSPTAEMMMQYGQADPMKFGGVSTAAKAKSQRSPRFGGTATQSSDDESTEGAGESVPFSCKPRRPQAGEDTAAPGEKGWPFQEEDSLKWFHQDHRAVLYGIEVEDTFPTGDDITSEVCLPRGPVQGLWVPCSIVQAPRPDDDDMFWVVKVLWAEVAGTADDRTLSAFARRKLRGRQDAIFRVARHQLRKRPNRGAEYWASKIAEWISDPEHELHDTHKGLRYASVITTPQSKTQYACDDPDSKLHPPLYPTTWAEGLRKADLAVADLGQTQVIKEEDSSLTLEASTKVRFRIGTGTDSRYLAVHQAFMAAWYVTNPPLTPDSPTIPVWSGEPGTDTMQRKGNAPAVVLAQPEEAYPGWLRVLDPPSPDGANRWIQADGWERLERNLKTTYTGAKLSQDARCPKSMLACAHEWRNEAAEWEIVREPARGSKVYVRHAVPHEIVEIPATALLDWNDLTEGTKFRITRVKMGETLKNLEPAPRLANVVKIDQEKDVVEVTWLPEEAAGELTREHWERPDARPRTALPDDETVFGSIGLTLNGRKIQSVLKGSRAFQAGLIPGLTVRRAGPTRTSLSEDLDTAFPCPGVGMAVAIEIEDAGVNGKEESAGYPAGYKGDGRMRYLAAFPSDPRDTTKVTPSLSDKTLGEALWVSAHEEMSEHCLWELIPSVGAERHERRKEPVTQESPNPQLEFKSKSEFLRGVMGEESWEVLQVASGEGHHYTQKEKVELDEFAVRAARHKKQMAEDRWIQAQVERLDPRPEDEEDIEWWQRDHFIKEWMRLDMRVDLEGGRKGPLRKCLPDWTPYGRWAGQSEGNSNPVDHNIIQQRVDWYHNYWRLLANMTRERLRFADARVGMNVELSPKLENQPQDHHRYKARITDKTDEAIVVRWKGEPPPEFQQTWWIPASWWDPNASNVGLKLRAWKAKYREENRIGPSHNVMKKNETKEVRDMYAAFLDIQGVNPTVDSEELAIALDPRHSKDDNRFSRDKLVVDAEIERCRLAVLLRSNISPTEVHGGGERYLSHYRSYPENDLLTTGDKVHGGRWQCDTWPFSSGPGKITVFITRENRAAMHSTEQWKWTISAYRDDGVEGARVSIVPPRAGCTTPLSGVIQNVTEESVQVLFEDFTGEPEQLPTWIPRSYWDSVQKQFTGDELDVGQRDGQLVSLALLFRVVWPPNLKGKTHAKPQETVLAGGKDYGNGVFWRGKGTDARAFDCSLEQESTSKLKLVVDSWKELGHDSEFVFNRVDDLQRDDHSHYVIAARDHVVASHVHWEVEPVLDLDSTISMAVQQAVRAARRSLRLEYADLVRAELDFLFRTVAPNMLVRYLGPNQLVATLNFKVTQDTQLGLELEEKVQAREGAILGLQGMDLGSTVGATGLSGFDGFQFGRTPTETRETRASLAESVRRGDSLTFDEVQPGSLVSLLCRAGAERKVGMIVSKNKGGVKIRWNPPKYGGMALEQGKMAEHRIQRRWFDSGSEAELLVAVPDLEELGSMGEDRLRELLKKVGGAWWVAAQRPGTHTKDLLKILSDFRNSAGGYLW
eukprot:Hpha_TRINITY_DN15303_c0_g1::TRINITY_DN15303_c0_g1_i1::g.88404::m.88404